MARGKIKFQGFGGISEMKSRKSGVFREREEGRAVIEDLIYYTDPKTYSHY